MRKLTQITIANICHHNDNFCVRNLILKLPIESWVRMWTTMPILDRYYLLRLRILDVWSTACNRWFYWFMSGIWRVHYCWTAENHTGVFYVGVWEWFFRVWSPTRSLRAKGFRTPGVIAKEWKTEAYADRHSVVAYGAQRIAPGARETVDNVFWSLDIVKLRI